MHRRRISGLFVAAVFALTMLAGTASAAPVPLSAEELIQLSHKYEKALKKAGKTDSASMAAHMRGMVKTNHKAAYGMYTGLKDSWDKQFGWQETKSQKNLKKIKAQQATAAKQAPPTDNKSFKEYDWNWRRTVGDVNYHLKTFCAAKADATCAPAKAVKAMALKKVAAGWETAMKTKAIEFDAVQDILIEGEREEDFKALTKLDAWIPQLAKEKAAYWSGKLSKAGGQDKYAKKGGKHVCVPVAKKGSKSLKYLSKANEPIWIRCVFDRPPAKFRRNDSDYWRLQIMWAGRWESLGLDWSVKKPSKKNAVLFKVPKGAIQGAIAGKMKGGFKYPGNYLRANVSYMTRYINGHKWNKKGVKVPVWKHERVSGTSTFVRWK